MTPRIKLNISLFTLMVIIILFAVGIAQRRSDPRQAETNNAETIARRRLTFTVSDLIEFAAQTPSGRFPAESFPAELDARSGAIWYFAKNDECWNAIQKNTKKGLNKPTLTPYREPNQPEPLLVQIEFNSGEKIVLKFVQDSLVDCQA